MLGELGQVGRGTGLELDDLTQIRFAEAGIEIPTATASRTPAWVLRASSTSSGNTFSPPVLMHTEPRPGSFSVPSASTSAQSPGTLQQVPSKVRKVLAVFSSSL
ncbi:MAG: hypothetical protein R2705_17950 [Ilumatobacteraceae bacterium]